MPPPSSLFPGQRVHEHAGDRRRPALRLDFPGSLAMHETRQTMLPILAQDNTIGDRHVNPEVWC
jgi:hypothetical protein